MQCFLVGQPEGKRPLWRPRSRWEGNIEANLKKYYLSWCGLDSTGLDRVQRRALVKTVFIKRRTTVFFQLRDS
jgi:hypothetical protein